MPPPLSGNTALSRDYYIITIIVPYSVHHSSLTKALFPGKGGIRWVGPLDFHETSCPNTNARSNMCFSPEKKNNTRCVIPCLSSNFFHYETQLSKTHPPKKKPTGSENDQRPPVPQKSHNARLPRHPEFMSAIMFIEYRSPSFQSSRVLVSGEVSPPNWQLGVWTWHP